MTVAKFVLISHRERMRDVTTTERVREKFLALASMMDERMRRQWAATEARDWGWGGVSTVSAATGMARDTITVGISACPLDRFDIGEVAGPLATS